MDDPEAGKPLRSILFLVRGDDTVPSCRFRAYQYREPLRKLGVRAEYIVLERSKSLFRQVLFHLRLIPRLGGHDAVIFQKLLEPWRLRFLRLFNGNLFFDFDDAMYAGPDGRRFPATMRAAPRIIAGNETLAARARRYHADVGVIPTPVPIPEQVPAPSGPARPFVLSWIGTAANLPYLDPVLRALEALSSDDPGFELRILTEKPERAPRAPWIRAMPWSRAEEEEEFRHCDVGLMPLPDTEWCAGKCACKALQYLSYGKPVITSPVGMNRELFADGRFGILAVSPEEWLEAIRDMRSRPDARAAMGRIGYVYVKENFSTERWAEELLRLTGGRNRAAGPSGFGRGGRPADDTGGMR